MDEIQHQKYKDIKLSDELVHMYVDLILDDEPTYKVLLEIGKQTHNQAESGITPIQLRDRIKVKRRIRSKNGYKYSEGFITRKHLERILNALEMMGVCYHRSVPPTKIIRITPRGRQIEDEIKDRIMKIRKKKGDSDYVES